MEIYKWLTIMSRTNNIIDLHKKRYRVYKALIKRYLELDSYYVQLWNNLEVLRSAANLVTVAEVRDYLFDAIKRLEAIALRVCRQRDKYDLWAEKIFATCNLMYSAYGRVYSPEEEFPYNEE